MPINDTLMSKAIDENTFLRNYMSNGSYRGQERYMELTSIIHTEKVHPTLVQDGQRIMVWRTGKAEVSHYS